MSIRTKYSARTVQGLGVLKASYHSLVVYVEDGAGRQMWRFLLEAYAPNIAWELNNIIPLNGRSAVLEACKKEKENINNKNSKNLYIIDADFDFLLENKKPRIKNLYRINRYCVENYVVSQYGIDHCRFVFAAKCIEKPMDVDKWMADNESSLRSLFVCYAVAYDLSFNGMSTVRCDIHGMLCDDGNYCFKKVFRRTFHLYRLMVGKFESPTVRKSFDRIKEKSQHLTIHEMCSAKNYIIPALNKIFNEKYHVSVSRKHFTNALSVKIDTEVDKKLKKKIYEIAK